MVSLVLGAVHGMLKAVAVVVAVAGVVSCPHGSLPGLPWRMERFAKSAAARCLVLAAAAVVVGGVVLTLGKVLATVRPAAL